VKGFLKYICIVFFVKNYGVVGVELGVGVFVGVAVLVGVTVGVGVLVGVAVGVRVGVGVNGYTPSLTKIMLDSKI
jgi:hypothetical protein